MAAYYKVDVVLNSQAVSVGLPSPQSVSVTLPLVGPQGPQGPAGPKGDPGEVSGSIAWDNVTDKPSTFAPSSHTHVAANITDFATAVAAVSPPVDWNSLTGKPSTFAPSAHTHPISDVTNLQTALDGKAASSHTHTANQVTDFNTAAAAAAPVQSVAGRTGAVTLAVADVSGAVASTDSRLSDSRTPTAHASSHLAGTPAIAASYTGIGDSETFGEEVTITANTAGTAGNSITLAFDGVDDVDTVLAAWNSANPSNQATLDSGDGGQVPDDGDSLTLSGGVAAIAGGSDPFANINQDLGTTNSVQFAGLEINSPSNGELLRIDGNGSGDVGFAVYNNTGNQANSFYFNQNNSFIGIGVGASRNYIQSSLPVDVGAELAVAGPINITGASASTHKATTRTNLGAAASGSITSSGLTQATARILGRTTASTGAVEEIQIGSGLSLSAGELSANFAAPPAIGNTTPAAGTFTTLTANNGTLTASAPALDVAQTWNASGTTFTALRVNVTDTASATASELLDLEVGSNRRLAINKAGDFLFKDNTAGLTANPVIFDFGSNQYWIHFRFSGSNRFTFQQNSVFTIDGGSLEVRADGVGRESGKGQILFNTGSTATDDSVILNGRTIFPSSNVAIRNGTNAQEFRIYNTFTSATNHERGFLKWSSNVFQIGTEKGSGGGTARQLDFQTDGQTRWSIGSASGLLFASGNVSIQLGTESELRFGVNTDARLTRDAAYIIAQRNGTNPQALRIYNTFTSATNFERLNLRWASDELIIDAEAGSAGGTLRGIKIGSATSSLLGFYGATPVVQQAAVADATDAASTQARLNDLLARLRTLGLIAT